MNNPEENGRTESLASGCEPFNPLTDDFFTKDRNYSHFDYRLTEAQRKSIPLSNVDLTKHDFWPLLAFGIPRRKRIYDQNGNFKGYKSKPRPIKFGSHKDAALLEVYGKELGQMYENYISTKTINRKILAYRKNAGNNITMAKLLFDEISLKGDCTAIALDVSGFFDNIQHTELKECLQLLFGQQRLPAKDFKVFKNTTRYSFVDSKQLQERLKKARKTTGRLCFPDDFRKYVREQKPSIIQQNLNHFGIPQGTPISGLYANISMLNADENINEFCNSLGATYRRYSDDIAIIIPATVKVESVIASISNILATIGLTINESKTEVSHFSRGEVFKADQPFQYLGFTYDGQQVRIRQSSIHNYYKKMRKGIRAKIYAAKAQSIPSDKIYMRQLLKRYTHYGQGRNFPRYAYRAAGIFASDAIRKQIAPHMKHFRKFKKIAISEIYK